MQVTIIGPGTSGDGYFHVHKARCRDIKQRKYWGLDRFDIDATSQLEITEAVYPSDSFEWDGTLDTASMYLNDLHFAPCVKLPVEVA